VNETDDPHSPAEAFALGALDAPEARSFKAHVLGCPRCQERVAAHEEALGLLVGPKGSSPDPGLRSRLLDLADAPPVPEHPESLGWEEVAPGIKARKVREDPSRGFVGSLVWAKPGARHPRHRHRGDENILVLQGALKDDRGTYPAGSICRSRKGSTHAEEALPGEDCFCFVCSYFGFDFVE
jgi:anti-sigma factor ChrR (cupin superfamily)